MRAEGAQGAKGMMSPMIPGKSTHYLYSGGSSSPKSYSVTYSALLWTLLYSFNKHSLPLNIPDFILGDELWWQKRRLLKP